MNQFLLSTRKRHDRVMFALGQADTTFRSDECPLYPQADIDATRTEADIWETICGKQKDRLAAISPKSDQQF
jgi:hypothetical protein